MPNAKHIGVSRRIEDETERKRLRKLVQEIKNDDYGYIVRTAAEGVKAEKLLSEMSFLNNLWNNILKKYKHSSPTKLIHKELTVSLRAVRDLLTHEVEKLIIDSRSGYESIVSFLDNFMPSLKDSVEYYEGMEPLFDAYNLEGDISRALKRKVWLKSGGYIVIEQTEAPPPPPPLSAIDVNTGRFVGKHNLEETILKTNLEAVKEIAYQIRIRDLGGIIIIDFIDMEKKSNQEKVYKALLEALKRDRSKTPRASHVRNGTDSNDPKANPKASDPPAVRTVLLLRRRRVFDFQKIHLLQHLPRNSPRRLRHGQGQMHPEAQPGNRRTSAGRREPHHRQP